MSWMAWTAPTAVFFVCVGLMLATMTALELKAPTVVRRGFLPLDTTRGDRLFIGLLSAAFIHLAWLAAALDPVWPGSVVAALWLAALIRWG